MTICERQLPFCIIGFILYWFGHYSGQTMTDSSLIIIYVTSFMDGIFSMLFYYGLISITLIANVIDHSKKDPV